MADIKAASFSRVVQKHAGRARERLLQNFGKADKTRDEDFDEYVANFNKQQNAAQKLLKEIKNYQQSLKAMQTTSKSLMESICDLYEPNWVEYDKIQVKAEFLEQKWEDFSEILNDQVIKPLAYYSDQFQDVQSKILKRGRKLLDYDRCRHHAENLEQTRKREESKLSKAKEQLVEARNLYEVINSELHEELPALYDSRISFFISTLQCLFIAEASFHDENAKIFSDLNDAIEALAIENQKGNYSARRNTSDGASEESSQESFKSLSPVQQKNGEGEKSSNGKSTEVFSCSTPSDKSESEYASTSTLRCPDAEQVPSDISISEYASATDIEILRSDDHEKSTIEHVTSGSLEDLNEDCVKSIEGCNLVTKDNKESTCTTIGNAGDVASDVLPPGVLYKVNATYKYVAEDGDELSFEPGDLINVVEFDDPEEQEEGWLMGFKDEDGRKGLFPANFTRPI